MFHALETGVFDELLDPKLGKNYNEIEMFRMIEVAAACVRHSAAMRPRMGQVMGLFLIRNLNFCVFLFNLFMALNSAKLV